MSSQPLTPSEQMKQAMKQINQQILAANAATTPAHPASVEVDTPTTAPAEMAIPVEAAKAGEILPDFKAIAESMIAKGGHVIYVKTGEKACVLSNWQNLATRDLGVISSWAAINPHFNVAVVAKPDGLWLFDDDEDILNEYESNHGPIKTYRVRSVSGGLHLYFLQNDESRSMGNLAGKDSQGQETWSARVLNRYVIAAGSVAHPNNDPTAPLAQYRAIDRSPVVEAPSPFITFLKNRVQTKAKAANANAPVVEGGRNNFLTSRAGKMRNAGMEHAEIESVLLRINEEQCQPPLSDQEVKTIAASISRYAIPVVHPLLIGGVEVGSGKPVEPSVEIPEQLEVIEQIEQPDESEYYYTLPHSALSCIALQKVYEKVFRPAGWPLDLALPALVTAASVIVPRPLPFSPTTNGVVIPGDDLMVNLYTALIAGVHVGKTQVYEWAAKAMNIWTKEEFGSHYLEIKTGSAEQFLNYLNKHKASFKNSLLVTPDEWAHLFAKATIPDASFPSFMTTAFYRQRHTVVTSKGKEINLDLALSWIGGIVEEEFDTVFNSASLGGMYDRFLFGRAPDNFRFDWRPYPYRQVGIFDWNPVPVRQDGSVFEVIKEWNKDPERGRIVEICSRIACIYASLDGREVVTGDDLEELEGLARYQMGMRARFRPNAGMNPDAIFANAAENWINKNAVEWTSIRDLKRAIHTTEMKLGPNIAERALSSLARGGRIDLWLTPAPGRMLPLPKDYTGRYPRVGLVRRIR